MDNCWSIAVGVVLVLWCLAEAATQVPVVFNGNNTLSEGDACTLRNGHSGVCSKLQDCDEALALIQGGNKPQLCSYTPSTSIVCCQSAALPLDLTPGQSLPTVAVGEKSGKACDSYYQHLLSYKKKPNYPDCPSIFYEYVIGGQAARAREFPHMAAIGYGEEVDILWLCGGSLISTRYVLTAAHCLTSQNRGSARWVRLGDLNLLKTSDDASVQQVAVKERIPHPEYKPPALYNDLALLRLARDVVLSEFIRPACIDTEIDFQAGGQATGWGLTDWAEAKGSPDLMKVYLPVQPDEQCSLSFASLVGTRKLREGFNNVTMLCVGNLEGGKDTCRGDSGGPYQVAKSHVAPCIYQIAGVTSFGKAVCGAKNSPAVYTRVTTFVPWIESIVWP